MLQEEIFIESVQQKNEMLQEVDEKIKQIKVVGNDPKSILSFVIQNLHKISIITSHEVFLQENNKPTMKDSSITEYIYMIDDLLRFQLSHVAHNRIVLSRTEIIENFKPFISFSPQLILTLITKQHYILLMVTNYFKIDSKRDAIIKDLIFRFAQVCRNYCNIKAYMSKREEDQINMPIIENIIKKSYNFQQWAVQEAFELWSSDKTMFWGGKCLQFWSSSLELYKLFNTQKDIEAFNSRLSVIEKRITNDTRSARSVKEVTLEELLTYDNKDAT